MTTEISWTDETWNPVTGCSKVSEGCRNCYAAKLAPRLAAMGQKGYTTLPWTHRNAPENVMLHEDRLKKPLRWKKPRRIFVDSMADLFHEQVPDEFIDRVFAVMALAPQHTFQILTKRPERMAAYLADDSGHVGRVNAATREFNDRPSYYNPTWTPHPLPNVWLGTSVEDQRAADKRIPHLLRTPAALRFLSCEPLIGPLDLRRFLDVQVLSTPGAAAHLPDALPGIDWVIVGGESGPGFREMDDLWARQIRNQCVIAGVPFFFKQSSGLRNEMDPYLDGEMWRQMPASAAGVVS